MFFFPDSFSLSLLPCSLPCLRRPNSSPPTAFPSQTDRRPPPEAEAPSLSSSPTPSSAVLSSYTAHTCTNRSEMGVNVMFTSDFWFVPNLLFFSDINRSSFQRALFLGWLPLPFRFVFVLGSNLLFI